MVSPYQRILFGSPGTGKSKRVSDYYVPKELGIEDDSNMVKTVFHPEYTYGDFMGKLTPLTRRGEVEYNYYPGDFLRALGKAYRNILESDNGEKPENVALVIDEINRGNSAEIFGKVFQLLDRHNDGEKEGWSKYKIDISEIQFIKLLGLCNVKVSYTPRGEVDEYKARWSSSSGVKQRKTIVRKMDENGVPIKGEKIMIPPNLSILATMNTSNESVYFMDSAFKRRFSWEYVPIGEKDWPEPNYDTKTSINISDGEWRRMVKNINKFMKSKYKSIRGIEDKQIGNYFIVSRPISSSQIKSKLMFFLWDSVFGRNKEPLAEYLGVEREDLITFGDFSSLHNEFVNRSLRE